MSYQLLNEEVIYSGRVFQLVKANYRLPNGKERGYDLVKHHGAVTILPVDEQGNIHFVTQFRIGAMEDLLELPAGVLEEGESPEDSAQREVQEEIGMAAGEMVRLGEFFMVPGYSTEKLVIFLATGLRESALPQDEDEFLHGKTIPVGEVMAMAHRGEIRDGKTLATLMLALPHLQRFLEKP